MLYIARLCRIYIIFSDIYVLYIGVMKIVLSFWVLSSMCDLLYYFVAEAKF